MKEKILVYLGAALAVAGLIAGANWYAQTARAQQAEKQYQSTEQSAEESVTRTRVKTVRMFTQSLTDILTLPGNVEAWEDVDVAVKRGGAVEWIGLQEGDRVEAGQKIAQVDVAEAEAQVAEIQTALDLAEIKLKRISELYEKGVAPVDQLDDARSAVRQSQAALRSAKVRLANGTLFSPISGRGDRKYVDQGEHVAEGQAVVKIVDISRVKVMVNVPEKDILFFEPGEEVELRVSGPDPLSLRGKVDYVALVADPRTRTFPLRNVVDNAAGRLRPGMIVRARLVRRHVPEALAVPFFAVVDREVGKVVFTVQNGEAVMRQVKTGIYEGGQVEILEGLAVGEELVVVGQRNLRDGEPVEVAADLTDLARRFIESGADPATLPLELLRQ